MYDISSEIIVDCISDVRVRPDDVADLMKCGVADVADLMKCGVADVTDLMKCGVPSTSLERRSMSE